VVLVDRVDLSFFLSSNAGRDPPPSPQLAEVYHQEDSYAFEPSPEGRSQWARACAAQRSSLMAALRCMPGARAAGPDCFASLHSPHQPAHRPTAGLRSLDVGSMQLRPKDLAQLTALTRLSLGGVVLPDNPPAAPRAAAAAIAAAAGGGGAPVLPAPGGDEEPMPPPAPAPAPTDGGGGAAAAGAAPHAAAAAGEDFLAPPPPAGLVGSVALPPALQELHFARPPSPRQLAALRPPPCLRLIVTTRLFPQVSRHSLPQTYAVTRSQRLSGCAPEVPTAPFQVSSVPLPPARAASLRPGPAIQLRPTTPSSHLTPNS
jgi:hypothetical protein